MKALLLLGFQNYLCDLSSVREICTERETKNEERDRAINYRRHVGALIEYDDYPFAVGEMFFNDWCRAI